MQEEQRTIRMTQALFAVLISVWLAQDALATSAVEGFSEKQLETSDVDPHEIELADPLEYLNRAIFQFNRLFDGLFLKPLAYAFTDFLSDDVQKGVSNVMDNLNTPITFMNDVLQADATKASQSFARFLINSSMGLGGIMDVAHSGFDIQGHKEDFGQTLGVWGIGDGPYIMLPLYGPSNLRDTIGKVVDSLADPFNLILHGHEYRGWVIARAGLDGVVRRAHVLDLTDQVDKKDDPYAEYRILYKQNRDYHIKDGRIDRESPTPSGDETD